MGHKDAETRKFNKEIRIKEKHRDLFKEAQDQEDVVTSTGANLDKFASSLKQKKSYSEDKLKQEG